MPWFDLRAEGPRVTVPVEARWAKPEDAFRRLENLRAETRRPDTRARLIAYVCPRTLSPSLVSCPASDGASSFLPASALLASSATGPCDSAVGKTRDASDRLLPPVRHCVHPHLARSRFAAAAFATWAPHGVWAPRGLTGGPGVSHHPDRFGGSSLDTSSSRPFRCRRGS